jgi:hypothetical protein
MKLNLTQLDLFLSERVIGADEIERRDALLELSYMDSQRKRKDIDDYTGSLYDDSNLNLSKRIVMAISEISLPGRVVTKLVFHNGKWEKKNDYRGVRDDCDLSDKLSREQYQKIVDLVIMQHPELHYQPEIEYIRTH